MTTTTTPGNGAGATDMADMAEAAATAQMTAVGPGQMTSTVSRAADGTATIDKIAWIHVRNGRILSTRSHGKEIYYLPGGKREQGETDLATLVREIDEELAVTIIPATAAYFGTFVAQAHGHPDGTLVRMTCYTASYRGRPTPSNEIEEVRWLSYGDRHLVSFVDQIIFDNLHNDGRLA
jgi:8-oxo-dGTP pyrophosphatase MutT (NUDIX family)